MALALLVNSRCPSLPRRAAFSSPIAPIDLLLLGEDRFHALYELEIGSIIAQPSIGANPVQVEPPLRFMRSDAVR